MKTIHKILLAGRLYHKISEQYCKPITKKTGLNLTELRILSLIDDSEGTVNARDISESLGLSKSLVSKSVDHLKSKGYLVLKPDPDDMRRVDLGLSDNAEPILTSFLKIKTKLKHDIADDIDHENFVMLDQSLDNIIYQMRSLYLLKHPKNHI
ncbi:MAG: MarR family transcriptional regulator [Eubacteriaceae bacterium]|nr:MarR family transcriptional regulator [Eubacteriaceae bacterium]